MWTPPTVLVLDTETYTVPGSMPELLKLRCWAATLIRRRPSNAAVRLAETDSGITADSLVSFIEASTRGERGVWCFAHNLGFDLTTTQLVQRLGRRGWSVGDFSVSGPTPWLRMSKGTKRLTLTDSWSWLPLALKDIGESIGTTKPDLPSPADTLDVWLERCRADVRITAEAILSLMAWWDAERLGRWTITGAATGWNAMRHRPSPVRVVIDPDPQARSFERQAIRGGRRDCFRVGTFRAGPYVEVDFTAAHPTVAAELLLPVERVRRFESLPIDHRHIGAERWGVIAECEIETDRPRFPMRWRGLTWWPTGRFRTVLAGPELKVARDTGTLRAIGPGYLYRLGGAMMPWARWVLRVANGDDPAAPAVARIAAKSWGRSVIGKWAGHTHESVKLGRAPNDGWHLERGRNATRDARGAMVDMLGQRWWVTAHQEPDNSFPAILAWVESEVRVRLGAMIDRLGPSVVLQADTDGVLVDLKRAVAGRSGAILGLSGEPLTQGTAGKLAASLAALTWPLVPRVKSYSRTVTVIGPQHLEGDGFRRLSGIRNDAKQVEPGRYRATLFPSLAWQMEQGSPEGFVCPEVTNRIRGPYAGKWLLGNGELWPVEAQVNEIGESVILSYDDMTVRPTFDIPAESQHPLLSRHLHRP